jgi:hypothetical protein
MAFARHPNTFFRDSTEVWQEAEGQSRYIIFMPEIS